MTIEKRKILLVDDVEENRIILAHRLEKEGFAVITASNGKDGLEYRSDLPRYQHAGYGWAYFPEDIKI